MPTENKTKHLKIKLKSLTAEARIIKKEEGKLKRFIDFLNERPHKKHKKDEKKPEPRVFKLPENAKELLDNAYLDRWNLRDHRRAVLRREARNTHLAYGAIRGIPYSEMESKAFNFPDLKEVERMVLRYGKGGHNALLSLFAKWQEEAITHYNKEGNKNRDKKAIELPKLATVIANEGAVPAS